MRHFLRTWRAWRQSPPHVNAAVVECRAMAKLVSGEYRPLTTYLEHQHSARVVLSFIDLEALLGFPLPAVARSDGRWWAGTDMNDDHHAESWAAADRRATPNLLARTVAFERMTP
jgi:hypothetical protein